MNQNTFNQILLWSLVILPWVSLLFMKSSDRRRFMPVGLLIIVINTLFYQAAYYYQWWSEDGLFGWDNIINVPWVYCTYPVLTMWIFKLTFGKFWRFMLLNLFLDGVYIYLWYPYEIKIGLAEQGTLASLPNYLITIVFALIIYLYQVWQDGREPLEIEFEFREKAR